MIFLLQPDLWMALKPYYPEHSWPCKCDVRSVFVGTTETVVRVGQSYFCVLYLNWIQHWKCLHITDIYNALSSFVILMIVFQCWKPPEISLTFFRSLASALVDVKELKDWASEFLMHFLQPSTSHQAARHSMVSNILYIILYFIFHLIIYFIYFSATINISPGCSAFNGEPHIRASSDKKK